jgi:ACT domain-containing protein
MKAIITVLGKDSVGIIARVSAECSNYKANILDITQKVFTDTFAMIMMVDTSELNTEFADFAEHLEKLGKELGLVIKVTHEDLFNSMHRI